MLTGIIRWSLRRPRLTAAASAVLFAFGVWYVRDTPVETFPVLTPAQTVIQTDAPGLAADQVEQLVTRPIENALVGAPGVATVRSDSAQGLSVIRLDLTRGDAARIRQGVTERLAQAVGVLPAGTGAPKIAPLTSTTGDVLQVGFTSQTLNPMQLRNEVEYRVRPRLLAAAGVANVTLYGGQTRRIEVKARPGDLSDSDLGFEDVITAVRRATSVAGAGFMDTPEQRVQIEPRGQALTADDVAAGQIQVVGNAPVRIGDVSDVGDGPAPAFGDALIMGRPGILLSVTSQYGADTLAATHAVEEALAVLRPELAQQGIAVSAYSDRPADFITALIRGLVADLLIGAILILAILLLVLRDPREVLVTFLGIPLSLLAALVAIKALGLTLNTMTVGGLFVALGIVIDDAVIDVESIAARLRAAEARHGSRFSAVLGAVLEVRTPVVYAALVIDIALLPMLFLGGAFGAFLAPLALTIIVASLASLLVSVCLTPAIALLLLQHLKPAEQPRPPGRLRAGYMRWIEHRCAAPGWALLALGAAVIVTVSMLALFHRASLPSFHDSHLVVETQAPAATSLEVMRRSGQALTQAALTVPGTRQAVERIGRDPTDFSAAGIEQGQMELGLDPRLDAAGQDRAEQRLHAVLAGYPQVQAQVRRRLDAQQTSLEDRAPFSVGVYGDDLDTVDRTADQLAAGLRALPGSGDVAVTTSPRAPSVRVDLNFKRLALYGLSAADVLDTVQTAFQGKTVAQVYQDGRPVDLAVTGPDSLRRDPEAIGKLLLRSSSGLSVPLDGVANVYLTDGRTRIEHEAGQRRQVITADPAPAAASRFAKAAGDYLDRHITLPPGVYLVRRSAAAGASAARLALLVNCLLAGLAMLGLLLLVFRDGRAAILILASTVFAFLGGAIAVGLTGAVVSLGSLAGFIALFGLSTRNAIILISRPHVMVRAHNAAWTLETVKAAASQRAGPIVLTALLVAVGVAPLAFAGGRAGGEILGPMAVVIMGGALSGAILTLLFLPALIYVYQRPVTEPATPEA
jgi:CzcA family heavy metal efflux pump